MRKKKLSYALMTLVIVLACALTCATAAACKKPVYNESGAEAGNYYNIDDDADTVKLYGNCDFEYSVNGVDKIGKYALDGENLTFTYSKKKEGTLSATLKQNVIYLTLDGTDMQFYKDIDYTVTYEVNGGSAVSPATVRHGGTATRPQNPVRSGYVFLGWYADAGFTSAFSFDSQKITGDITLYARWAQKAEGQDEYEISFDLNYQGAQNPSDMTTIGGRIYDAPVPQREGYKFNGWWISMYGDKDKLSYAFTESTVFDEATTLYALWQQDAKTSKLPAPVVNISANLISWDGILNASKYVLEVSGPEGFTDLNEDVGATSRQVNFSDAPAGDYVVKVTAVASNPANNSDVTVRYYLNKGLKKVTSFKVTEPSVLVFNEIEHAEKYLITVECGDEKHSHTNLDLGDTPAFDFSNCAMKAGGIKFTVTAVAAGYASSVSETFAYSRDLAKITNLAFDAATQTLKWDSVSGATGYIVTVGCDNGQHEHEVIINNGSKTDYCVKEYEPCGGKMVISVYPYAKGYNPSEAVSYTFNKINLATPSGIRIVGNTLYWSEVANASSYDVKINGIAVNTQTAMTSLDLTNPAFNWTENGDYKLSIKAIGATDSLWSDELDIRYYAMYTTLTYGRSEVSWRHVVGADSYEVKVNGGQPVKITNGQNFAEVVLTKAGENVISVRFNEGSDSSEWVEYKVFAYTVTLDGNGGDELAPLYKAKGDKTELPQPNRDGYQFIVWYNTQTGPLSNGAAYLDEFFNESSDITLYAYYEARTYTATLFYHDGRDRDGTEKTKVNFNSPFKLPVPESPSEDKTFGGWFSDVDGKGIKFTDERGASVLKWPFPRDTELHAFWKDLILDYNLTVFEGEEVYEITKGRYIYNQTEVTVPETYQGKPVIIGPNAFYGCSSIVRITIPDTIKLISAVTPFAGCTKLEEIKVVHVDGNTDIRYWTHGGVLYDDGARDNRGTSTELIFAPLTLNGSYAIPEDKGVTTIVATVFADVKNLTDITVPASVTHVGSQAFKGCTSLATVTFTAPAKGADAQPLTISDWAFEGCTALKRITLPARLDSISLTRCIVDDYGYDEEFNQDGSFGFITEVNSAYGNSAITDAFKGCSSLAEIVVDGKSEKYSSYEGVLFDATGTVILYCPSGKLDAFDIAKYGVAEIADGAFYNSKAVYVTEIPSSVNKIGECAFYKSNVRTLVFKGGTNTDGLKIGVCAFAGTAINQMTFEVGSFVTEIGEMAFYSCSGLTKLELSKEITKVDYKAFFRCTNLTEIKFADNTNAGATLTLGEEAFNGCTRLATIYLPVQAVNLPGFVNCPALKTITVSPDSKKLAADESGAIFSYDKTTLFYFPANVSEYAVPEKVKVISEGVFRENKTLTKITVGKNVTLIGKNAFYGSTALTDVIFEEGGEEALEIAESAFYNCSAIKAINLPARILSIGNYAFYHVGDLTSLTFGENSKLEFIGEYAFANVGVTYVEIPKLVAVISPYAFTSANISEVKFEKGSTLAEIGYQAFSYSKITSINIPATVTVIAPEAFYSNVNLVSVIFEEGGTADLTIGALDTKIKNEGYYVYGETFSQCSSLKAANLPARTTEIGYGTFYNCSALKTVTFAEKGQDSRLKFIGDRAFANSGITEIVIPKSVGNHEIINVSPIATEAFHGAAVSEGAFAGCSFLKTVTFEAGNANEVTIDKGAFSGCISLNEVILPAVITGYIDENGAEINSFDKNSHVFDGCVSLESFKVDSANEEYKDYKGIIYNSDFTAVIICPPGIKSAEIHDDVKALSSSAFDSCNSLTYLSIPGTLANLANALKKEGRKIDVRVDGLDNVIKLENGILCGTDPEGNPATILYVPDDITGELVIPKTVTRIAELAFQDSKLSSIKFEDSKNADLDELYIENSAFILSGITSIAFPARLKSIGTSAFIACAQLSEVTFEENCKLTQIGNGAFFNCPSLTSIEIPAKVEEIPDAQTGSFNLFGKCTALTSVTFAEGSVLKKVGSYAFAGSNITEIVIPSEVTVIGSHAFDGAENLSSVTFAANSKCETVGSYAFSKCTALTEIVIPASVKYLVEGAFSGDTALSKVTFESSGNLESVGASAFKDCTALTGVSLPSKVTSIGNDAFNNCKLINYIAIPFGVTALGDGVFSGCTGLTLIDNVSNVTSYGVGTFRSTAITSFVIPDGITQLPADLFRGCNKLVSVTIPDSVKAIGDSAFLSCTSLKDVTLPDNAEFTEIADYLFSGCTKLTGISVPNTVKTIGRYSFSRTAITEFNVPDSVITIELGAFSNCTSLKTVTGLKFVAEIKSSMDDGPFEGCVRLASIELPITPAYTAIASGLFTNCTGLASIKIPSNVQTINGYAFSGCKSLATVQFEDGLITIGANAFYNCSKLAEVKLPATLQTVGNNAFNSCFGLKNVEFNTGLLTIGNYAFSGCTQLNVIKLPVTLRQLGSYAFKNCISANSEVEIPESLTTVGYNPFAGSGVTGFKVNADTTTMFVEEGALVVLTEDGYTILAFPSNVTGSYTVQPYRLVGPHAFEDSNLSEIVISENVKLLYDYDPYSTTDDKYNGNNFYNSKIEKVIVYDTVIVCQAGFAGMNITDGVYFVGNEVMWKEWLSKKVSSFTNNNLRNANRYYYSETYVPGCWRYVGDEIEFWREEDLKDVKYTFEPNNGQAITTVMATYLTVDKLPRPVRDGYVFEGWYDNKDLTGKPVTFPYFTGKEATLYAKWISEYDCDGKSKATAFRVNPDSVYEKQINVKDSWFAIPLMQSSRIRITVQSSSDIMYFLYDSDGRPLENRNGSFAVTKNLKADTYYINVNVYMGAPDFTIRIEQLEETPGSTKDKPIELALSQPYEKEFEAGEYWFKLSLKEDEILNVYAEGAEAAYTLYTSADVATSGGNLPATVDISAGTYYLYVYTTGNGASEFTIHIAPLPGSSKSSAVDAEFDKDYQISSSPYWFKLTSDRTARINISAGLVYSTYGDMYCYVYDESGTQIATKYGYVSSYSLQCLIAAGKTYYVQVRPLTGSAIKVNFTVLEYTEISEGSSKDTAIDVNLGESFEKECSADLVPYWFTFTADVETNVEITFTDTGNDDIIYVLFDEDSNVVTNGTLYWGEDEFNVFRNLQAGKYFLFISLNGSSDEDFTIHIDAVN